MVWINIWCMMLIFQSQIMWAQEPRLEVRVVAHTVIYNYPLTEVLLSVPFHICSFGNFGSSGKYASISWQTVLSLNWRLRLPVISWSFYASEPTMNYHVHICYSLGLLLVSYFLLLVLRFYFRPGFLNLSNFLSVL